MPRCFGDGTTTTEIYTLSLHDALPIFVTFAIGSAIHVESDGLRAGLLLRFFAGAAAAVATSSTTSPRSEEHTSELQSQSNLVCRLLLEKKKNKTEASNNRISLSGNTKT